jgi:hypothetical protein
MLDPVEPSPVPTPPRRRQSGKGDVMLFGLALATVLCLAAALKFRNHPALVVATESTTVSASTFPPVELKSTSGTAVLAGTVTPGAVVRVLDHQVVADNSGGWHITVDLAPGINHFQAVSTDPSGVQVATNFTVLYTPPVAVDVPSTVVPATDVPPTARTSAAPPTVANATTTVAVNLPVTISSPLDGTVVTTPNISMLGTAAPGARVKAAGTAVTATRNGVWSAVVTLKPGAHRVTVTATTPAGVTTASITIRYNPPATTTSAETTAPAETTVPTQTTPGPVDSAP